MNFQHIFDFKVRKKFILQDWYIRVIDESGEDHLYPEEYFLPIELPTIVYEKLKKEYEKFYKHQLNLKEVSIRLLNIIETLPENL